MNKHKIPFIVLCTLWITLSGLSQNNYHARFIQKAVSESFDRYHQHGDIGISLEMHDSIPGDLPGSTFQRILSASTYLLPEQGDAIIVYEELIFGSSENPLATSGLLRVQSNGDIVWALDSLNAHITIDQWRFLPGNQFLVGKMHFDESSKRSLALLIDLDGHIVYLGSDIYSWGFSADHSCMLSASVHYQQGIPEYRIGFSETGKGVKWERFFHGKPAPRVCCAQSDGAYFLISRDTTLICIDKDGNEVWTASYAGRKQETILSSGFDTFLKFDNASGELQVLNRDMTKVLASFSSNEYSDDGAGFYRICAIQSSNAYAFVTVAAPMTYGLWLIDENHQLRKLKQEKMMNNWRIKGYKDNNSGKTKIFLDNKLVYEMEGRNEGKKKPTTMDMH